MIISGKRYTVGLLFQGIFTWELTMLFLVAFKVNAMISLIGNGFFSICSSKGASVVWGRKMAVLAVGWFVHSLCSVVLGLMWNMNVLYKWGHRVCASFLYSPSVRGRLMLENTACLHEEDSWFLNVAGSPQQRPGSCAAAESEVWASLSQQRQLALLAVLIALWYNSWDWRDW